jgi:hypothetical protein
MRSYILSYDLRKPGRNYENLIAAIQKYAQWAKPLESVWIIKANQTASEVRDNLSQHLDPNDGLIVVEFGGSWAA